MKHECSIPHVTLSGYRICLVAEEALHLPRNPASTLRGALGHGLKHTVCAQPHQERCSECLLVETCPYAYLFATSPPEGSAVLTTLNAVPRPIVIEPPFEHKPDYLPGDVLAFGLTLVGKAVDYLPYIAVGLQDMGCRGLGRNRGRCLLATIETVNPLSGAAELVFDSQSSSRIDTSVLSVNREALGARARALPEDHLEVAFVTPTRLKHHGDLTWHGPPFHVLIRRLLDRVSALSYFHCGERWDIDFKGWIERAKNVQIADAATQWVDWERHSGRQDQRVKMGGLVGPITYTGDLAPFRALLALGALVHVGKGTVMGNGRFAVKGLDDRSRPSTPTDGVP